MAFGGGQDFGKQKPGRKNPIAARTLNRPIAAVEQLSRAANAPGIASMLVGGIPLTRVVARGSIQARITGGGTSGIYSWRGEWGYAGHYTDLPSNIAGTTTVDSAFELNANTAVASGTHVTLRRDWATGRWTFQYDACS